MQAWGVLLVCTFVPLPLRLALYGPHCSVGFLLAALGLNWAPSLESGSPMPDGEGVSEGLSSGIHIILISGALIGESLECPRFELFPLAQKP